MKKIKMGALISIFALTNLPAYSTDILCTQTIADGELKMATPSPIAIRPSVARPSLKPKSSTIIDGLASQSKLNSLSAVAYGDSQIVSVKFRPEPDGTEMIPNWEKHSDLDHGKLPPSFFPESGAGCTQDLLADATKSDSVLIQIFSAKLGAVEAARSAYLIDPIGYSKNYPDKAIALRKNVDNWAKVYDICFGPAAEVLRKPEFKVLEIPTRLGFLTTGSQVNCLGYMVSNNQILTARHCIYSRSDRVKYFNGQGFFTPIGDPFKHYQVCAAQTSTTGVTGKIEDEPILLRIAPSTTYVSSLSTTIRSSPSLIPLFSNKPSENKAITATGLLVLSYLPRAAELDASFGNSLGVGTGNGCAVLQSNTSNHCFTNLCSTFEGSSGGPVFAQVAGIWQLTGIHLGSVNPADSSYSRCTVNSDDVNTAAFLDTDDIANHIQP